MAQQDKRDRVWQIIEAVGVGMLATRFAGGLRARPVEPRPERAAGLIWILTDDRSAKDHEIAADPEVCLIVIDAGDKAYLSLTAQATVLRDSAKAATLWHESDRTWWPQGPEDPNLRLLRLEPQRAELWDGPASAVAAALELAKSRLTGHKPNLGENRKVTLEMRQDRDR
jgi:general stress protein 26